MVPVSQETGTHPFRIKQGGSVVAHSRNALPGLVAVTASTASVSIAVYEVCLDITAVFINGSIVEHHGC